MNLLTKLLSLILSVFLTSQLYAAYNRQNELNLDNQEIPENNNNNQQENVKAQ